MTKPDSKNMDYLDGKLLIAMPGMPDMRFEHSVIFMCAHSDEGAMGIIVNKPAADLKFKDLLTQLNISSSADCGPVKVHFGGPVEHGRGFVLHSTDYELIDTTMAIGTNFGMTATIDVLKDLAMGSGPTRSLLALGYAGWGPGQLESEIQANGWLVCDAKDDLVFSSTNSKKWEQALYSIGVDARLLSATGGQA